MIRINLLPVRQVRKVQAGQRQLLLFIALIVAELVLLFFLYEMKSGEIEEKQRNVRRLEQEIKQLQAEVGDFDRLKQQRDRLLAQRNVINQLHAARTGPVFMMRELSEILSVGKGPTVDREKYERDLRRDPTSAYNPRWNPRRLWIGSLKETSKAIGITGSAKDHDDVAEFHRRLKHSLYFKNVQLARSDQVWDGHAKLKVVKFSMSANVIY